MQHRVALFGVQFIEEVHSLETLSIAFTPAARRLGGSGVRVRTARFGSWLETPSYGALKT
jgi:hypothetical protein